MRDRVLYNIGWDYASHGLWPLQQDLPLEVIEGHKEGTAHFRGKAIPADRYVKKWLQLRYNAATRGRAFSDDVTPAFLREIDSPFCPVTKVELTHGSLEDTDWSVDRVINSAGYSRRNLLVMSTRANHIKGAMSLEDVRTKIIEEDFSEMTAIEWHRLHAIMQNAYVCAELLPRDEYVIQPIVQGVQQYIPGTWPEIAQHIIVHCAITRLCRSVGMRSSMEKDIARLNKTINTETSRKLFHKLLKRVEKKLPQYRHELDVMWDPRTFEMFMELFYYQTKVANVWPFDVQDVNAKVISEKDIASNRADLCLDTAGFMA